jgi:hypothetical protein
MYLSNLHKEICKTVTIPINNIHDLNIFATMIQFLSYSHVLSHVYDYMTKSCHEFHNYMIEACELISNHV